MTMLNSADKLSDKDLEQVSGGAIVYNGGTVYDVVDDNDGHTICTVSRDTMAKARSVAKEIARGSARSSREITYDELQKLRGN